MYKFDSAVFKYHNSFLKFYPKNTQRKHFFSQTQAFLLFTKVSKLINLSLVISNITIVFFNVFAQRYPNMAHFDQILRAFIFPRILQIYKFEGADFKYGNSFLKFQPKNTKIKHFWSRIQLFSFLCENLQIGKFEGADFKYDNSVLKFQHKHTQIRHFWSKM